MSFEIFVFSEFCDEAKGDRFDGFPGVSADRCVKGLIGRIDFDFDQTLDRIDGSDTVCPSARTR